ncbi:MAG: hypothetical protein A3F41_06485 [Coxiella sp. RIFCSPHIGHO2_12_FULL_44_14]|nr:MAG: hypothetical protein A3F41_06485 [Coxiella sp. RIFCSPHIGHO2_12_FULL_44_14]
MLKVWFENSKTILNTGLSKVRKVPTLITGHAKPPATYGSISSGISISYTKLQPEPAMVATGNRDGRVFQYLDYYVSRRSEAIIRIADFIIWTLALASAMVAYLPHGKLTKYLRFLFSPLLILITAVGLASDYGFGPRQQILDPKFRLLKEKADALFEQCNQLNAHINRFHKLNLVIQNDAWQEAVNNIKSNIDKTQFENLHTEIDHRSRLVTYPGSLIILFSWLQATYQILDRATGNGQWSADVVIPTINLMLAVFAAFVYWHYYANTLKKANLFWDTLEEQRKQFDQLRGEVSEQILTTCEEQYQRPQAK